MSIPPFPSPVAEPSRPGGTGPVWNTAAAAGVGVLVIAFIAAAVGQIFWLRQGAADATTLGTLISGSPSPDALATFRTTLEAHLTAMHTMSVLYQAAFWVMFIAFFGWQAILRSHLRAMGRSFDRRSTKAWLVWRVGMVISIVMIFVAQDGVATIPDAIASTYHRLMAYYAVRALVGAAYLWVVYSVWRSAGAEFATLPATSVGRVSVADRPPIPMRYPLAPQGYPAVQPPNPNEPSPWSAPASTTAESPQA